MLSNSEWWSTLIGRTCWNDSPSGLWRSLRWPRTVKVRRVHKVGSRGKEGAIVGEAAAEVRGVEAEVVAILAKLV
jgi:hypothetical protein